MFCIIRLCLCPSLLDHYKQNKPKTTAHGRLKKDEQPIPMNLLSDLNLVCEQVEGIVIVLELQANQKEVQTRTAITALDSVKYAAEFGLINVNDWYNYFSILAKKLTKLGYYIRTDNNHIECDEELLKKLTTH